MSSSKEECANCNHPRDEHVFNQNCFRFRFPQKKRCECTGFVPKLGSPAETASNLPASQVTAHSGVAVGLPEPVPTEGEHAIAEKEMRNGWTYIHCTCGMVVGPFWDADNASDAFDYHRGKAASSIAPVPARDGGEAASRARSAKKERPSMAGKLRGLFEIGIHFNRFCDIQASTEHYWIVADDFDGAVAMARMLNPNGTVESCVSRGYAHSAPSKREEAK